MNKLLQTVLIVLVPGFLFAQGSLLLVGGGSEDYNGWSDAPYGWFVEQADSGKIINIDVDQASSWYPGYFGVLGADDASMNLRIGTRELANDSAIYHQLISAQGIFIEGGDQWDYVETWKGTLVEDAIHAVFESGGAIGGTSAGLALLGEVAFDAKYGTAYPDYAAYDPYYQRIHLEDDFLHIFPGVLTDTHFQERGRIGRLVPMLARRIVDHDEPEIIGIGVDAQSAFCVDADFVGTAYGGSVTLLYADNISHLDVTPGEPTVFTNIHFDQLLSGAVYDLQSKTLLETGPYMEPVTPVSQFVEYPEISLDGSDTATASYGTKVIENIYDNPDAWWQGNLEIGDGEDQVPHSIFMPKIWNLDPDVDDDYFPNRIVGGQFGAANFPGYSVVYLDDGSTITIAADGTMTVQNIAYVLDTKDVTYAGANGNMPGLINARLHFLRTGNTYNLQTGEPMVSVKKNDPSLPESRLQVENYPNPFNGLTTIEYSIPSSGFVQVTIFSISGKHVKTLYQGNQPAGTYSVSWNSESVSSGIYLIQVMNLYGKTIRKVSVIK